MHSIKEYEVKVKKLEKINKAQGEKIKKLKKTLSEVRKDRKYAKKRVSALEQSRANWKAKHKDKQLKIKALKSRVIPEEQIERHKYPKLLVVMCVLLRVKCGCSYGSIVKILKVLQFCLWLNIKELRCENSLQNWVSKTGLHVLKNEDKGLKDKEISLIVDESIRMGQEKQLLILGVGWKKEKTSALNFEDVEVLHMEGSKSWTGEKINQVIEDLIAHHGFVVKNILSDEDSKLKKASRLADVVHVPDIAHGVGTCLKKSFGKHPEYKAFTTLVSSYQSKGVNQDLSYLCPPKQRTKARFMNQKGIVKWANKMLERFGKLGQKEEEFFSQLPEHEEVITQLADSLSVAEEVSVAFKKEGLNDDTLQKAEQLVEQKLEGIGGDFLVYLKGYLDKYRKIVNQIGDYTIHVSSEIIESFLGKYKSKAHNHPLTGLTKLNLELPLYAKSNEELAELIPLALENVSMTHLNQWLKEHSTDSQLVKRIRFFKKRTRFSKR